MRRKILIVGAAVVAIAIATIGTAILYLSFADLSGWRPTVERLVSEALGRELTISGAFAPDLGLTTRLVATEVSLANPPWSSEPEMLEIDRLDVSLEVLPLLAGRIRILQLTIDGARAWLEIDADGRSSWTFDTAPADGPPSGPPSIEFGTIALRDVTATYRTPSLDRPLTVEVAGLDLAGDADGKLSLRLEGALNGSPLRLAGELGPLHAVLSGGAVAHSLEGRLGGVTVTTVGTIQELSTLAGADLTVAISGPDTSEVTELVGLPSLGDGPFEASLRLSPMGRDTAGTMTAALGRVVAEVEGKVDALVSPRRLDARVSASGPDLAAAGALVGMSHLPAETFDLSGHVAWDGFPVMIDDGRFRVGDAAVSVDGVIGALPHLLGTDLTVEGSGPDLAWIGRLTGLDLPGGEFSIRGHLQRRDRGIGLEAVELRAGGATVSVDGTLGDPPELTGTDLVVRASGRDLSAFSGLARRSLPAVDFEVDGRLLPTAGGVAVKGVTASAGAHRATVDGTVAASTGLTGSDLTLAVEGPDLSWLLGVLGVLGVENAPAEPYSVAGRLEIRSNGLQLDDVTARIRDASLSATGRLGRLPSLVGTDATVRIEGADASWPAALAGLSGFPAEPFEAHGRIRVPTQGFDLEGLEARVGGATLSASGRLGPIPNLTGTDLSIDARLPTLASFDALVSGTTLPAAPASVSGRFLVRESDIELDDVVVEVQGTRIAASGSVARTTRLVGSDIAFELISPDLDAAARSLSATGAVALPELPAEPLTVAGRLAVAENASRIDGVRLTLGEATARIDGSIGRPPDFRGTDLTVSAEGPRASLVAAMTGLAVPMAPFRIEGRLARLDAGYRFEELRLQLGEYHASGNGTLGEPPRFEGTDFDFEASGPSLALFRDLTGVEQLHDLPFRVGGHLDGDPRRFEADRISARLGGSDLAGWFRIDLDGVRPRIEAELLSRRIDLTEIIRRRTEPPASARSDRPAAGAGGLVFSDQPLTFEGLSRLEGHLRWSADVIGTWVGALTDIELDARLEGGALSIEPIQGVGAHGGRLDGQVELEPTALGRDLRTTIQLRGARVDLTAGEDPPSEWPSLDLDLELAASGSSPHEMASSANGRIAVTLGSGPVDDSVLDLLAADLVVQVLQLLNPFSGKEQARLECGVVVIAIDHGLAALDPFAIQTDHTTVVGDGTVDLSTEDLDLRWVTKPRKGLGISASTITNAYLKLGGTLANPKIETKPLEALATTGVAVATGGLSLLGRGLFNRISAEKNLCKKAIERANRPSR